MLIPTRTSRPTPHTAPHRLRALLTAGALIGAGLMATAAPAHAATSVCDQFGSTTAGSYVVQNNAYNTSGQCISVDSDGFQITQAPGSVTTNGAPKSYPSMYIGCHYGNCSPGTNLPRQMSAINSVPTSISDTYVGDAVYDASYDIWLDPTPKTTGVNQTEIMIWLNRVGSVQPVGSQTGSATVDGTNWAVWQGNNGSNNVISFVAPSAMSSASLNVKDFIGQAINVGLATDSWYLTSVQAGFEPWENGAGLAVNSFSASVN
jgi:Glycosyl hydrolase family 12